VSGAASVHAENGVLRVRGALDFSTVAVLWTQGLPLFGAVSGACQLDVSDVDRVDSAGVALLLEWMRLARAREAAFSITGAPPAMKDLVRLADLQDLLPVTSYR
jgi:phospholipid transport system transporter-binding protein